MEALIEKAMKQYDLKLISYQEVVDTANLIEDEEKRDLLLHYFKEKRNIECQMEEKIERLEKDLVNRDFKITCLKEDIERGNTRVDDLNELLDNQDDLKYEVEKLTGTVEDWKKKYNNVAEVSAQQIQALEEHIAKLMNDIEKPADEEKDAKEEELMEAVDHLQKTLKLTEAKYRKLKRRYVDIKKQDARESTLEGMVKGAEDRNAELLKTLENEKLEKTRALTGFVEQTRKVARVLKEWDEGSMAYENMIKDIKEAHADTCAGLHADIEVLVNRTSKLHDEKMEMEHRLRGMDDQIEVYEMGQKKLLDELSRSNWHVQNLHQENSTLMDQAELYVRAIDRLEKEGRIQATESHIVLNKLGKQLDVNEELKGEIQKLTVQLDTMGVEEIESEDEEKKEDPEEEEFEAINESDLDEE